MEISGIPALSPARESYIKSKQKPESNNLEKIFSSKLFRKYFYGSANPSHEDVIAGMQNYISKKVAGNAKEIAKEMELVRECIVEVCRIRRYGKFTNMIYGKFTNMVYGKFTNMIYGNEFTHSPPLPVPFSFVIMNFIWTVSNKFDKNPSSSEFTNLFVEKENFDSSNFEVGVCGIFLSKAASETENIAIYSSVTKGILHLQVLCHKGNIYFF